MRKELFFLAAAGVTTRAGAAPYEIIQSTGTGEVIFQLGDIKYLSTVSQTEAWIEFTTPSYNLAVDSFIQSPISQTEFTSNYNLSVRSFVPLTVVTPDDTTVSNDTLNDIFELYSAEDDVFMPEFLENVYVSAPKSTFDATALSYLSTLNVSSIFVHNNPTLSTDMGITIRTVSAEAQIPNGPYLAHVQANGLALSRLYKLYEDTHQTFISGTYPSNDGSDTYNSLGYFHPELLSPMIPVPSRIYYWHDDRPFAGQRFGIKDIYEVKGLKATRGSRSWYRIANVSDVNAPSVQRILDLGGVIVGKQKTSQFASGDNPWGWNDFLPPFNPRGDGYLTPSSSSAGGGTSIAAYDWLDYAIGSDTGQSMRRPAAVAGVYGGRPSQGLMSLEHVMPITHAGDTAGVFARNPAKWAQFSRQWYIPELEQDESITHLPPLDNVPDSKKSFPKRFLYAVDWLPMDNPQAEALLDSFLTNITTYFNMTVGKFNFAEAVSQLNTPSVSTQAELLSQLGVLWQYGQIEYGKQFVLDYKFKFGSFPPTDAAFRGLFRHAGPTAQQHMDALQARASSAARFNEQVLPSTEESCSENIIIYDIGSQGLPNFRERGLNEQPGSTFLAHPGTAEMGGNVCSWFGCADYTIPIGQVPYYSNVTFEEVNVPVTVSMVVRRGCDHVFFDFVEEMYAAGLLAEVKTGVDAF